MMMIKPIIISGPSGGGKSTILAKAMKEYPDAFAFSVSHTTRKPRDGELDGQHYYFIEKSEFERMIKDGEFLEHAQFGGNFYGTSKKAVQDICNSGKICVLDVELQGVRNFKKAQFEAKYIFVRPPSMEVLELIWFGYAFFSHAPFSFSMCILLPFFLLTYQSIQLRTIF
uniref:Guanylate kinase-like domain-containing protein n=1 Tax=Meloidogyne incognita TaxID=6306 RepID=A0A914NXH9_MELIC